MKTTILLFLCSMGISFYAFSQHNCQLDHTSAANIKQRLMDNRARFSKEEVADIMNKRNTTYIPISFHSASNSAGEGAATQREIFNFMCGLNDIYADQNVQFFIYNQINFRTSDDLDTDASTNASASTMNSWKINGTMNINIGRSQNNATSSWYSYSDYIFLLKSMMSPEAKTEAHEIGHFFTLPHTFYGWEGIDVDSDYGGQSVPSSVGSGWSQFSPEAAPRTGAQANCSTTADGFCDTEADYYSSRKACPYTPAVTDPFGNAIDPDETNLMSYALDNCVYSFSTEQKTAIALDIAQRSWVTNTPNGTVDLSQEPSPTPQSPANMAQLGSISDPTVRLDWTDVNGAGWYYIEVYNTLIPGIWVADASNPVHKEYLYSSNSYFDLSTANLQAGKYYAWRITPLSNYSTCAAASPYYKFQATTTITDVKDLPISKQISFELKQNPVTHSSVNLEIYTAEDIDANISLIGLDGRVVEETFVDIQQGSTLVQLPADDIANGIYFAVLRTDRGILKQKVVIQK